MKRFWDTATSARDGEGWSVLLDGAPVRIPEGPPLRLCDPVLAEAVAAEWQAAGGGPGGETGFADLPLTRIAGTAQLRVAPDPEPVVLAVAQYAASDLLCYRATQPAALALRQASAWQPWLDWAERRAGAGLTVTSGVMPVTQAPAALAAYARWVAGYSAPMLAALGVAVPALGSLVLGLAVAEGELLADAACDLAMLDEIFQAEQWGEDAEAAARRAWVRADIAAAGRFMTLARA